LSNGKEKEKGQTDAPSRRVSIYIYIYIYTYQYFTIATTVFGTRVVRTLMMVPIVNTPTTIPQTFLRPCGIRRFHHQSNDDDDDDDDNDDDVDVDTDDWLWNVVAVFDGIVVVANDANV
jgi:hypothetical protein